MYEYKLDVLRSPVDDRDFNVECILSPKFELPESVDYRDELPPAWDQGREGACSAFAAAAMKQWQEFKDYGLQEEVSKYFIYNLRSNFPNEGMYPRDTMEILKKHGISLEKSFNREWIGIDKIPKKILKEASNHVIKGYAKVSTVDSLKKSLFKNGPCYIAFPVWKYDSRFWKPNQGQKNYLGGHAVSAVGYDKRGFIIRNSWGTGWYEGGHTLYPYEDWGLHWEIWTTIDDTTSEPVSLGKPGILQALKGIFK